MQPRKFALIVFSVSCAAYACAQSNVTVDAKAATRDPFWPVGYSPAAASAKSHATPAQAQPAAAAEKAKAALQIDNLSEAQQAAIRAKLKVSGIMRFGPDYVARINNQLVATGDELPVELEGQRLVFLVRSIDQDAVQLEPKK